MMTNQFGQTLRRLRRDRMISQNQLSNRAGFDHSYVSRLEAGGRDPSRQAVAQLADALRLADGERDLLFGAAGFSSADDRFRTDPELVALAAILWDDELDAGHRERVRHVLRSIAHAWSATSPVPVGGL